MAAAMLSLKSTDIFEMSVNSLAMLGGGYVAGGDGELIYPGQRPADDWHRHGWLRRQLWLLVEGRLERRRIRKQRWLHVPTGKTCHSKPHDEVGGLWFCSLVVVLKLWAWLVGPHGLHNIREVDHALDEHGSKRSVQRWLRRAQPAARHIQQAIRGAVMERCEPQAMEELFPDGLSPPACRNRRWREPESVATLTKALTLLFTGAIELKTPTSTLLAEARGRCSSL